MTALALGIFGGPLAAAADESTKTPKQIVADAQRDLAKVRSYHFQGSEVDGNTTTRVAGDVAAAGQADITIREGASSARIIFLPHALYLKANAAYWKANGGSQGAKAADKLAGRWFKTNDASLKGLIEQLMPKHVAACLPVGTGTLKKGGTSSANGKRAVVVVARGDKPATTPGRLYVAATAPILPLRMVQTGKRRPGGHIDTRCQDKTDTSTNSDLRFSGFDKPLHTHAPHGAIALPDGSSSGAPA